MICQDCVNTGLRSVVNLQPIGPYSRELFCPPFWDFAGKMHLHDYNLREWQYQCTQGHNSSIYLGGECWCGWKNNGIKRQQEDEREKKPC